MNWQDIIKPFSVTPVVETHDSLFDKGFTRVAGDVGRLNTYLQVPEFISAEVGYFRRLMFQYNYTFTQAFYLTNIIQLRNFGSRLLSGGCLCVKWRAGTSTPIVGRTIPNVFRYRLLDYRSDINWSGFPLYTNQKIPANFCLEFWQDVPNILRGVTQSFMLQTDILSIPQSPTDTDILIALNNPLALAQLVQPIPLVFPIDWSNQAFNDN